MIRAVCHDWQLLGCFPSSSEHRYVICFDWAAAGLVTWFPVAGAAGQRSAAGQRQAFQLVGDALFQIQHLFEVALHPLVAIEVRGGCRTFGGRRWL